jgi:uncharacterized protein YjiK
MRRVTVHARTYRQMNTRRVGILHVIFSASVFIGLVGIPSVTFSGSGDQHFSLTYLNRFKVKNSAEMFDEPSGLALSRGRKAFWTVSDDTKKVFKLDLDGEVNKDESFKIIDKDLEGIALGPSEGVLVAVKEDGNEILQISIADERVTSRHSLSEMAGYGVIRPHFEGDDDNKGLEGITLNTATGTFFVLKEGEPGLLIEIAQDLGAILGHRLLGGTGGFADDDESEADIDYSGIQYGGAGSRFWIVSDKAKRLYLYDWALHEVLQSATLGFAKDSEYREVQKAEGITLDAEANRLYVITDDPDGDDDPRLYVFDVRWVTDSSE